MFGWGVQEKIRYYVLTIGCMAKYRGSYQIKHW